MTYKKRLTCLLLVLLLTISFATPVYANPLKEVYQIRERYQNLIDQEKGTLFEKTIANLIGSIAYTLTYISETLLGFKNLDTIIFNKNLDEKSLPPFDADYWNKLDLWYRSMSYIALSFMVYATVMVGMNFVRAGTNPKLRENALDSLKRLMFSWIITAAAPAFVRLLFRTNNFLVEGLTLISSGSVADQLGVNGAILKQIRTGNVIATSFTILLFAFINFRLNIIFLIRQFVMTVLYIFTPFVAVMWVINKDVNAAGIWLGEMLSNAFMQFSYAFVFTIYLSFTGENVHWATAVIWAMLCLSVAEVIRNSMQSLRTRLSGIDESREASKIMGLLGAGALPSVANTVGGQFTSATGPTGMISADKLGKSGVVGSVAMGKAGSVGVGTIMGSAKNRGQPGARTVGSTYTYHRGHIRFGRGHGHKARGYANTSGSYTQTINRAERPEGGSIEKASALARALDHSAAAGYYTERGLLLASGLGRAAAGEGGAGLVRGISKIAGTGVRGVRGAIGMAKETRKYMRDEGKTFKEALKDLTGADTTGKAFLRAGNLYMSHVATSQQRVRDKLTSYHTSIDGVRYK